MKCTASRVTLNGLPLNEHLTQLKANHANRGVREDLKVFSWRSSRS